MSDALLHTISNVLVLVLTAGIGWLAAQTGKLDLMQNVNYNFMGMMKRSFTVFGAIIVICIISFFIRGLAQRRCFSNCCTAY